MMETPSIVFEDAHLILCVKPAGYLSEEGGSLSMPRWLAGYETEKGRRPEIYVCHRLDQAAGGLMVYARRKEAAGRLTAAMWERQVTKEYLAVCKGRIAEKEGTLNDLLFRDAARNKTFVVKRPRKGVREASLSYTVLEETAELTLVKVRLHTGRTHQIRVQFASRGLPLLGDGRYGGGTDSRCSLALWSHRLAFSHPAVKKELDMTCPPPCRYPWDLFACLATGGSGPLPKDPPPEHPAETPQI